MSTLYTIVNKTGATVYIIDANGNLITLGRSGDTVSLSDSGYQKAVSIFGAANVVSAGGGSASSSPYVYTSLGDQAVSVTSGSAVPLNPPSGAITAFVQVSGGNVRYRSDGVAPTATVGTEAVIGASFPISVQDFTKVSFIAEGSTATLSIGFFK